MRAKECLWPLMLLGPALPFLSALGIAAGLGPYSWWAPTAGIVLAAALERLLGGEKPAAGQPSPEPHRFSSYHRACLYALVPVYVAGLLWSCSQWTRTGPSALSALDGAGLAWAAGVSGAVALNAAHELGHGRARPERLLSELLCAPFGYGHYRIEHGRGHHARVATPEDPSSARLGESFWRYLPRVVTGRARHAWRSETERLVRHGHPPWSRHNALLRPWALTVCLYACLLALFGIRVAPYLAAQATVAVVVFESVSYFQHYGLLRERTAVGRYAPPALHHSWNTDAMVGNILLCQAQRHSDHHVHPLRPYQTLRHVEDAPRLPRGYLTLIPLAWIPPLWRRVMDPRVVAHYGGDVRRANIDPAVRARVLARHGSA